MSALSESLATDIVIVCRGSTQLYVNESDQPCTTSERRAVEETFASPSTQVNVCSASSAATSGGIGGLQAVRPNDAKTMIDAAKVFLDFMCLFSSKKEVVVQIVCTTTPICYKLTNSLDLVQG
jgi:hypothetical protein